MLDLYLILLRVSWDLETRNLGILNSDRAGIVEASDIVMLRRAVCRCRVLFLLHIETSISCTAKGAQCSNGPRSMAWLWSVWVNSKSTMTVGSFDLKWQKWLHELAASFKHRFTASSQNCASLLYCRSDYCTALAAAEFYPYSIMLISILFTVIMLNL